MGLWRSIRKNAALLTVSSLVMQSLSMLWQVWLAAHIGPAGIGLFQLIGSVGFLFITLAVSGIRFSVTRLLAEELGQCRGGSVCAVMRRCCAYALFFGLGAAAILFLLAEPIGFLWIGDARAVRALYAAAPSLPALALSSALSGYFTAVGRVWKTALSQFFAQLLRMGLSALLLAPCSRGDLSAVCAALSASGTAAEIALSLALAALYLADRKRFCPAGECGAALTPRMLRIALPLASSAYARSALNTFRQLLVPRGLRLSGLSAESALAGYGVINGMAMPVLLLPTCLPLSVAELLVPALTEMQVAGEHGRCAGSVREMLGKTFLLSLGAAAAFFVFARPLGMLLYGSAEAARFLRAARADGAVPLYRHRDRRLSQGAGTDDGVHGVQHCRGRAGACSRVGPSPPLGAHGLSCDALHLRGVQLHAQPSAPAESCESIELPQSAACR